MFEDFFLCLLRDVQLYFIMIVPVHLILSRFNMHTQISSQSLSFIPRLQTVAFTFLTIMVKIEIV